MKRALHIFLGPDDPAALPRAWSYRVTNSDGVSETGPLPSLDALAEVLQRHGAVLTDLPWTELPTFGGAPPSPTDGVWSWDERRLLVGVRPDLLELISRDGPREVASP
ncbi:hypothetical protein [Myxococcus landrumensis]|uniref:Uncharacterized protein n=1 Tax=Myxococcus landrumensis TaxID=2813577 RepID=A0ABX7NJM7_9BACT|nr:hypothetical protein [Myxococcus landrumus]QSQ17596.1 hypothetical protein JY572_16815 [Myxococcus landrumus]